MTRQMHFPIKEISNNAPPGAFHTWVAEAPLGEWCCYHRSSSLERYGPGVGSFMHGMYMAGLVTLAQFRAGDGDFMYLAKRTAPPAKKPEWRTRG